MLCALTKWLISRREDTGKILPSWAEGHLRRCPCCLEFARRVSSWREQSADLRSFDQADIARSRRILSRPAAGEELQRGTAQGRKRIPAAAFAVVFAAVMLGVIWLALPRTPALPSLDRIIDPEKVSALREEIATVESPLRQEMDGLEQKLDAAISFLISRLDPGLGQVKEKSLS